MRILVIGATGTIGKEVASARASDHEVVGVSRGHTPTTVDISDIDSIRLLYESVGWVDAVVSAAGNAARRRPLAELSDEDFAFTLSNKLMGQVNLVRPASPTLPMAARSLSPAVSSVTRRSRAARLSAW